MFWLKFSQRLKELRKEKNLTQVELGSILNYGYTAIANYENGRNHPSLKDIIRIANIIWCVCRLFDRKFSKIYGKKKLMV